MTYTCGGGREGGGTSGSAVFFFFFFPLVAISDAFRFCALVGGFAGLSALRSPNGFLCVSIHVR